MSQPIELDIAHQLGKAGARARLDGNIARIGEKIPGGATVEHRWEGDTMHFTVGAMGQNIASRLTVFETHVHAIVDLPPFMALFAGMVKASIEREGPKLLR